MWGMHNIGQITNLPPGNVLKQVSTSQPLNHQISQIALLMYLTKC